MSGKRLQLKRGTTTQTSTFTGLNGEVTVDTTKKTLVVHDGSTVGGTVLAKASDVSTSLALKVNNSEKGVANGLATLDVNGKVVLTQIPDSVLGQLEYMGTWNFTTLPTATQKGQYWIASVSGNGYIVGDWAVWNGSAFDKVDNTDAVATVAGRTGNVVLTKNDVGLSNVDNTADGAKPVSTAQQAAIDTKVAKVTSTGNAIVRFDGTTGNVKNSAVIIDDAGNIGIVAVPSSYTGYRTLTIMGIDSSHGGILELVNSDSSSSAQIFNTADKLNIGTNTNHPLVFYIANTERMRLDASGVLNVTSNPTNGRINIGASSNYIYGDTFGNFIIGTGNTDRVNITSNGILVGNSNNGQKCIGINHETGVIQSYQHNITINIPLILNPASGGGNVLIGTTTDNGVDKLQVNGSISDSTVRYISQSLNTNSRLRVTISLPPEAGASGRIEVIKTRGINTFFNTVFGRQYNETPAATDISGTTTKTITANQIILEYVDADGLNDMYSIVGHVTKNCTVTVTTY